MTKSLTKRYTLFTPDKLEFQYIRNLIENKLDLIIKSRFGYNDSYSLTVFDKNGDFFGSIDIDRVTKNDITMTTISQRIEGKLINDKEYFNEETDLRLLLLFLNQIQGLFICKEGGFDAKTYYSINYDKNSLEYKILDLLLDDMSDPAETLSVAHILKDKKSQLLTLFLNKDCI